MIRVRFASLRGTKQSKTIIFGYRGTFCGFIAKNNFKTYRLLN